MTLAQLLYPFIACAEAALLYGTRSSGARHIGALRVWLLIQLAVFCVLEPASFLNVQTWTTVYFLSTVACYVGDFVLLFSLFDGIRDEVEAEGDRSWWIQAAVVIGLGLALFASEFIPEKAHGIQTLWLATSQTLQYLRLAGLIVVAVYGCIKDSEWPREIAWTWLGMAVYTGADAIGERLCLHFNAFGGSLQYLSTAAGLFMLFALWLSLGLSSDPVPSPETFKGPS